MKYYLLSIILLFASCTKKSELQFFDNKEITEDTIFLKIINEDEQFLTEESYVDSSILVEPMNGTLTYISNKYLYEPHYNFNGKDSFSIKTNEGLINYNLTINSVFDPDSITLIHNEIYDQDVFIGVKPFNINFELSILDEYNNPVNRFSISSNYDYNVVNESIFNLDIITGSNYYIFIESGIEDKTSRYFEIISLDKVVSAEDLKMNNNTVCYLSNSRIFCYGKNEYNKLGFNNNENLSAAKEISYKENDIKNLYNFKDNICLINNVIKPNALYCTSADHLQYSNVLR